MFQKKSGQSKGFTIIEVLIVLAIAGLIMLIVFLAVPALQRNSRNTQAKSEAAGMLGALSEFTNNNNGVLPIASVSSAAGTNAATVFANAKFSNTTLLTIQAAAGATAPTATGMVLRLGARCTQATGSTLTPVGAAGQVALLYMIENSAGTLVACQES